MSSHPVPPVPPAPGALQHPVDAHADAVPHINLALQGGGSHGAFTWGVLDALLADGRVDIEGLSGTSAGAMNAAVLAHGFAASEGKSRPERQDSAREALSRFWEGVVSMGAVSSSVSSLTQAQRAPFDLLFGRVNGAKGPTQLWTDAMTRFWSGSLSPYQRNPFDINPLKDFLEKQVDFDLLASRHAGVPKVFVLATRVSNGKAEVFSGKRLTASAVMASACLPTVFQAVEIDGDHFWDGGYSGNPAIHPLIYNCKSRDIVLVQINPLRREALPKRPEEIVDRVNEITFNGPLIAEMRAIDFVKRLLAEGKLDPAHYKDVLMHRIDGGEGMGKFNAATKTSTDARLIHDLRDLGVLCGQEWLARRFKSLGVECTVNIARDYLDDLRMPVEKTKPPADGDAVVQGG